MPAAVASCVPLSPEALWAQVGTLARANTEMAPWLRLTGPDPAADLASLAAGGTVRCRLRGPGGLPLGPYPLTLVAATPGAGFHERSELPSGVWEHRRTLEADGTGTVLIDRLTWTLRTGAAVAEPVVGSGVRWFFGHRHARLRARLGGRPVPAR